MTTETTISALILGGARDYESFTTILQTARVDGVEEFNKANSASFTQEELSAAIEDLDLDAKNAWLLRMEDAAKAGKQGLASTFDTDRTNAIYLRFLRYASIEEIETVTGLTVDEAQERIAADGTLF
jgi:hypothetical protein